MARYRIAALALALAACGGPATPGSGATSAPSSAATPTPSPRGPLVAVLGGNSGVGNSFAHTSISLVGLDGRTAATATFSPRAIPNVGNAAPLLALEAVVAAGGAYFVDGAGVVRRLDPNGRVSQVTAIRLTAPARQAITFAVSPDGSRVAATVVTFAPVAPVVPGGPPEPTGPTLVDRYLAAAGADARPVAHAELSAPDRPTVVAGWDAEGLLLTTGTWMGTQAGTGGRRYAGDHLVRAADPAGVVYSAPLGGQDCLPWDHAVGGATLCSTSNWRSFAVRAPDATPMWSLPASATVAWPILSPDAARVAMQGAVAAAAGISKVGDAAPGAGGAVRGPIPAAWIDSGRLLVRAESDQPYPGGALSIVELSAPATLRPLGVSGAVAGVIPG